MISYIIALARTYFPKIIGMFIKKKDQLSSTEKVEEIKKSLYETMLELILNHGGNFQPGKPFFFELRNDTAIDRFNDVIGLLYMGKDGEGKVFACKGTTDPGLPWVKNPIAGKLGAAMMCLGPHNDIWIRGKRSSLGGKKNVMILRQNGSKIRIRRDVNKSGTIDQGDLLFEGTGMEIQMHPMSFTDSLDKKVGRWSAGCHGPAKISDYNFIYKILTDYDKENPRKGKIKFNRWSTCLFDHKDKRIPLRIRSLAI